ncbi:hypothetical protein S40285_10747 [Stachybotrys chlorohalonatus IBT 40285]|uniref:Uncharacterized protein n=1 Tax=Stachybotrys chlorohalonatus (strain IBT 40285) TaxID=1283841 RepID=A0A084QSB7_STAC4|nr:hypothetical protein S40285_10747 [Stachybotrys chlorohalonata IBT 40285]
MLEADNISDSDGSGAESLIGEYKALLLTAATPLAESHDLPVCLWNFTKAEEGATDEFFDADFGEELDEAQKRADLRIEGCSGQRLREIIAKDNWAAVIAYRAAENI